MQSVQFSKSHQKWCCMHAELLAKIPIREIFNMHILIEDRFKRIENAHPCRGGDAAMVGFF